MLCYGYVKLNANGVILREISAIELKLTLNLWNYRIKLCRFFYLFLWLVGCSFCWFGPIHLCSTEYSNLISYHLFFCWRIQIFFNFKRISITLSGTSVLQDFQSLLLPYPIKNRKSHSFHMESEKRSERERNGKVGKFILTIAFIWIINCYNSFLSIRLDSMLPLLLLHDPFIDFQFAYYSNIFLFFLYVDFCCFIMAAAALLHVLMAMSFESQGKYSILH